MTTKCGYALATIFVMAVQLLISYFGQVYFQQIEKDLAAEDISDCEGETFYNIDQALKDFKQPTMYSIGLMSCYCN